MVTDVLKCSPIPVLIIDTDGNILAWSVNGHYVSSLSIAFGCEHKVIIKNLADTAKTYKNCIIQVVEPFSEITPVLVDEHLHPVGLKYEAVLYEDAAYILENL